MPTGKGAVVSDQPITVEYDALRSLGSLLEARGTELRASGGELRGVQALLNSDVSAGQLAIERLWGQALTLLDESLGLTATKVGRSVILYQEGDHTVACAMAGGHPDSSPMAAFPVRATV